MSKIEEIFTAIETGKAKIIAELVQSSIDEGVDPSVGSVGDAYDNALAESQIGLYKAELIRPEGPWRGVEHVELETLNWVDFFNDERPHEALYDLTPAEPANQPADTPGRFKEPTTVMASARVAKEHRLS